MRKIKLPFKKPKNGLEAVPQFLMKKLIFACVGIVIFIIICIMLSIFTLDTSYLVGIVFAALCFVYGFFEKIYPFMTENFYTIQGTVVPRDENFITKAARPVVYLALDGDVLVKVPLNRRNSDYVEGTVLKVYFKGDVMTTAQNSYTLLDVIAIETEKVGVKKKK